MATSNFESYEDLPGIYFMCYEDIEENALQSGAVVYTGEDSDEDAFWERLEAYIDEYWSNYCILCEEDIHGLQKFIEECNDVLWERACRLYQSPRYNDGVEYENLRNTKITLKGGYYMGYQIAVEGDYDYLNKTSKKLVRKLFMRIARKFYLPVYGVAYRCSNGETGFRKIKDCKPTAKERAMGW